MHINIGVALKPKFMSSLLYRVLNFLKYAFSSTTLKILNLHSKSPKILAIYMLSLKCCLHPDIPPIFKVGQWLMVINKFSYDKSGKPQKNNNNGSALPPPPNRNGSRNFPAGHRRKKLN